MPKSDSFYIVAIAGAICLACLHECSEHTPGKECRRACDTQVVSCEFIGNELVHVECAEGIRAEYAQ